MSRLVALLVCFAVVACGPTEPSQPTSAAPPDDVTPDAGAPDPCLMLERNVTSALETTRPAAFGAVLAAETSGCPRMFLTLGEAQPGVVLDPHALFRIGSVTKTFVAAAMLRAQQLGLLDLDTTVAEDFPDVPHASAITVRQLLNHTSGVFNYTNDAAFWQALQTTPARRWRPAELVAIASRHTPYFAPGEGWRYSNTNYIMAGIILERVTGQPLAVWLREQFLTPLGLHHTFLDGAEAVPDALPFTPGFDDNGAEVTYAADQSWAWAAGAMVSTPADLLTWANALYSGSVLNADAMAQMLTVVPTEARGLGYGLGMFELSAEIGFARSMGHMGDTPGYHTHMFFTPSPRTVSVLFTNADSVDPNTVAIAVLPVLYGLP
jgi:D-alanyl-D-alanine carboxypeptidase